jgi:hypothetical protein
MHVRVSALFTTKDGGSTVIRSKYGSIHLRMTPMSLGSGPASHVTTLRILKSFQQRTGKAEAVLDFRNIVEEHVGLAGIKTQTFISPKFAKKFCLITATGKFQPVVAAAKPTLSFLGLTISKAAATSIARHLNSGNCICI